MKRFCQTRGVIVVQISLQRKSINTNQSKGATTNKSKFTEPHLIFYESLTPTIGNCITYIGIFAVIELESLLWKSAIIQWELEVLRALESQFWVYFLGKTLMGGSGVQIVWKKTTGYYKQRSSNQRSILWKQRFFFVFRFYETVEFHLIFWPILSNFTIF